MIRPDRPLRARPDHHRDWRVNLVIGLSVLVTVLLALGTPAVISSANTTSEIKRGSDLQACRSIANTGVTEARAVLDERGVANDVLLNRFVDAVLNSDRSVQVELQAQLPAVRDALLEAATVLRAKTDLYNEAVRLSSDDPSRFLEQCEVGQ